MFYPLRRRRQLHSSLISHNSSRQRAAQRSGICRHNLETGLLEGVPCYLLATYLRYMYTYLGTGTCR